MLSGKGRKRRRDKGKEYQEQIFYVVFTENKFLPDNNQLIALAADIGLNQEEVKKMVEDEQAYLAEVEKDKNKAKRLQITGIQFFYVQQQTRHFRCAAPGHL